MAMKNASDSLQVGAFLYPAAIRCSHALLLQILMDSADAHARSIAAADLAAGQFFALMCHVSRRTFDFTAVQSAASTSLRNGY